MAERKVKGAYGPRHGDADGKSGSYSDFADEGRCDRHYRFSVKCNRLENTKVDKLAKAAGVTPTKFVQMYFEQLFAEPKIEESSLRATARDLVCGQATSENRVLQYMKAIADKNGKLTFNRSNAAEDMSCSYETLSKHLKALILDGKIAVIARGARFTATTYQITGGKHV